MVCMGKKVTNITLSINTYSKCTEAYQIHSIACSKAQYMKYTKQQCMKVSQVNIYEQTTTLFLGITRMEEELIVVTKLYKTTNFGLYWVQSEFKWQ